ncbi:unnamed protein product [Dicrocoelium dendriticum]|nr:unnamed protein product [Dicrocoelium dendriticum]
MFSRGGGNVQAVLNQLGFGWYQMRVIIFVGIAQSTDTMEAVIQAILGPTLRCEWNLDSGQIALLGTMVFLGVCIGSPPLGYVSDHLGRKNLSLLCCIAFIYMTLLCATAPTFNWLAALLFISGLYIGGLLTAGGSLISEFLPESHQATGQLLVCLFDACLGMYIAGIGFCCLITHLSWRVFLLLATPPLIISATGLSCFLHESPVLLTHWGRRVEAAQVLDAVAKVNHSIPSSQDQASGVPKTPYSFVGRLHDGEAEKDRFYSSGVFVLLKLFVKAYRLSTPLLMAISFIWGVIMYGGTTLLPVEMPLTDRKCIQSIWRSSMEHAHHEGRMQTGNQDCCTPLLREGYISLLASMVGSILSFPIALIFITLLGRRWTINVCFFLTSVMFFAETFCMQTNVIHVMLFITRAVASAGNNATTIYLTGLYSSRIRSLAYGVMSTSYRIGVLTSPFLGQIFLQRSSVLGAILIFSFLAAIGFVVSLFLPHSEVERKRKVCEPRKIFKNVFKSRAPITEEAATAAASGNHNENDEKTDESSSNESTSQVCTQSSAQDLGRTTA